MTTEFFALPEDATAQEAIRRLQLATDAEMVFYIYVTDKDERLVGVLSLRQLLTVPPTTPLKNIATRDVISVTVDMDQEEVARQVASYNLLAIPVIDNDNRLVGIITVDDVVDVIREEATEDMLKMAGAIEEDSVSKSSSVASAKHRLPWLFTNLVGSLLSGAILWEFRYTIQEVVAIVSFIPVIAAMGGNVGLQSSTLIIRGLATGLIELTDVRTVFFQGNQGRTPDGACLRRDSHGRRLDLASRVSGHGRGPVVDYRIHGFDQYGDVYAYHAEANEGGSCRCGRPLCDDG